MRPASYSQQRGSESRAASVEGMPSDSLTTSTDVQLAQRVVAGLLHDVPDFPSPGIIFKDITPVLASAQGFAACNTLVSECLAGLEFDFVMGIESRGLILGATLAASRGVGFVPIRKPNKLPRATHRVEYALEYGTDSLEVHIDAVHPGARVVLVDDVLATGGTAAASLQLIEQLGAVPVAAAFLLELDFLDGRRRLGQVQVCSGMHL